MDPADEFNSPYVYVGGDPVNLVDPDGRQAYFAHGTFQRSSAWTDNLRDEWSGIMGQSEHYTAESNVILDNTKESRASLAASIVSSVMKTHKEGTPVDIIGYSHGGMRQ